jgi:ATP-dependent RNA helicase RhlE
MSFSALGLSKELVEAVTDKGYTTPTPIQEQAVPAVLSGKDVMAAAQTGTGKTAAFTLPLIQRFSTNYNAPRPNHIKALVLTPTRELAAQVAANIDEYKVNTPIKSAVVFGGVSINPQMKHLRRGCDILVATPGRLLDLFQQNAVKFSDVSVLVLDEADRMLDMGFIHDIKRILKLLPQKRQNLLFSATFSDDIRGLASKLVNDPVEISVTPNNAAAPSVEHSIVFLEKANKSKLLINLIETNGWQQALVFTRTKHGANRLTKQLCSKDISAAAIHGNKSQGARTKALASFKSGELRILVATDIAARGIDIQQLPNVVNYDLPNVPEDYVHRIGRTGRAGSVGQAVSFVTTEDIKQLTDIQNLIQQVIPVLHVKGLSSQQKLPVIKLKPPKAKKPKKQHF